MDSLNFKSLIPVSCFALAFYGLYNYVSDFQKNFCDMTYMFEYPDYIQIPLKYEIAKQFPRYKLYVYGEGRYAEELRNDKINGIPVLFIPGNAGSHRQVRSLASVAMRMGHSLRSPFHFNMFAVDLKGEFSGFYGGFLDEQTEFIQVCIKHIQSLYPTKQKLILIGHSMGGVIARAVFSIEDFDPASISIIFTLASPHRGPPLQLDHVLPNFYQIVAEAWKNRLDSDLKLIPVISVGSGERDWVVRSDLTSLGSDYNSLLDIHVLSTAVPGVWVSTDHLAIAWCKQLVLTVVRSLYDLIDGQTKQVTTNMTHTAEILRHHFIKKSYGRHFSKLPYIPENTFPFSGQWIEQLDTSWRYSRSKVISAAYILVPLIKDEYIIVIANGMIKDDWIFGCTAKLSKTNTKTCLQGENLSKLGEIIPAKSKTTDRKMANLVAADLLKKGYSHIVVYVAASNTQVDILGERYKPTERFRRFTMPSVPKRMVLFSPVRIMTAPLVDSAVYYNLTISGLGSIIEAGVLTLETRICKAGSVVGQGIMKLHIPWSREDQYYHIRTTLGGLTSIPIKLHLLPPKDANRDIQLQMILDPECSYVLLVNFPISIIATQFIKFYGLFVPGYTVALVLTILSGQLYAVGSQGSCPTLHYILGKFPTSLSLNILPSLLYYGIWVTGFAPPFLPVPDDVLLESPSFYSLIIVRIVLYAISYGLIITISLILEAVLASLSVVWMWLRHRTILKATEKPLDDTSKAKFQVSHTNLMLSALLGATAICFAGSVAIAAALYFYLSKLLVTRGKCKAEEERRGASAATSKWHFHLTIAILWLCTTILLFPGMIAWARGLSFSLRLLRDPHTIPCVMLILSSGFLWQLQVPCSNRIYYRSASHAIHVLAILTALYGIKSTYRLLYFICAAFFILVIQQITAFFSGRWQVKVD